MPVSDDLSVLIPEAVILAGGLGTRLQGLVPDVPKPMAPIAGRPFLEILLASLAGKGVTRAVLSLGHLAETVIEHFGRRHGDCFAGIALAYCVEPEPLGTGGALRAALQHVHGDAALVVNGDTYLDLELGALAQRWQRDHRPLIVARAVDDTARFGRLVTEGLALRGFAEKAAAGPGTVNTGHYLLPRTLLDRCKLADPFSFEIDFLMPRVDELAFEVFMTAGEFIDIGVPADYLRAQQLLSALP